MNEDSDKSTIVKILLKRIMKTNEIIRGNVFIIPNPAISYSDETRNLSFWHKMEELLQANADHVTSVRVEDNQYVQVWYCTSGSDNSNWVDHCIDGYPELKGWRPVSPYLPVELLKGHTEGQTITINLPVKKTINETDVEEMSTIKVALILSQNKYRYRNFGTFENVLDRLTR